MESYYIVKRTTLDNIVSYLGNISRTYEGFTEQYNQAIAFEDVPTATAFMNYCISKDDANAFNIAHVSITVTDMSITNVGE